MKIFLGIFLNVVLCCMVNLGIAFGQGDSDGLNNLRPLDVLIPNAHESKSLLMIEANFVDTEVLAISFLNDSVLASRMVLKADTVASLELVEIAEIDQTFFRDFFRKNFFSITVPGKCKSKFFHSYPIQLISIFNGKKLIWKFTSNCGDEVYANPLDFDILIKMFKYNDSPLYRRVGRK